MNYKEFTKYLDFVKKSVLDFDSYFNTIKDIIKIHTNENINTLKHMGFQIDIERTFPDQLYEYRFSKAYICSKNLDLVLILWADEFCSGNKLCISYEQNTHAGEFTVFIHKCACADFICTEAEFDEFMFYYNLTGNNLKNVCYTVLTLEVVK